MNIHLHFHLDNLQKHHCFSSVQFSSLAQSRLTLCNPMNRSTPGLLVHYQLLEPGLPVHYQLPAFTQTHVHWVGNAIQPSLLCCPLLLLPLIPPRIRVFSNESALHMKWPKYWSFSFSISPSSEHPGLIQPWTGWISLQSKGLSRVFSNTTVQKHQFFGAHLLHNPTLTSIHDNWKNHSLD